MNKFKIIISSLMVSVIGITLFSVILSSHKDTKVQEILGLKAQNSFCMGENNILDTPYYFDSKINNYHDIKQIEKCFLSDSGDILIKLETIEVMSVGSSFYKNKEYYGYVIRNKLPNIELNIEEASIIIECQTESIEVLIGSLTIYQGHSTDEHISIDQIYGIIGDDIETPYAIVLEIYNKSTESIIISDFQIGNDVFVNKEGIVEIDLLTTYSSKDNIDDILGYKYNRFQKNDAEYGLVISPYQSRRLVLPLYYDSQCYFYQSPMRIIYSVNGKEYLNELRQFMFFDNTFKLELVKGCVIKND